MGATRRNALATATAMCAATLLAACGSGTKTVTVSSAPPVSQTTGAQTPTQPQTTSSSSTPPPAPTSTQPGTASTRSAPEPAFTEGGKAEGASAAAAIVRAHGYTPNDTGEYHASQTLRVLVGTQTGSSNGYGEQAFFFIDGRYLGTDTKAPSATVKVVGQADTEATLAYPLYRKGDALGSPSGGEARVTFQLNNGQLVPLQKIPPAAERN